MTAEPTTMIITAVIMLVILYIMLLIVIRYAVIHRSLEEQEVRQVDSKREARYRNKRRMKQTQPDFLEVYGYSYDWVLVFEVHEDDTMEKTEFQQKYSMKNIIGALRSAGLHTHPFYSVQRDEVYCKVRCPLKRLMEQADQIDHNMQLDEDAIEQEMRTGRPGRWRPRQIVDTYNQCIYHPFEFIYGPFEHQKNTEESIYPDLYRKTYFDVIPSDPPIASEFNTIDRIKVIQSIMETPHNTHHGCGLNLNELEVNECILGAYPLHDRKQKLALEKHWMRVHQWPWKQPFFAIKSYFGEKIGLYFAFLGHYTSWLIPVALMGLALWTQFFIEDSFNTRASIYFALIIAVWATLMLEYWKRRQSTLVMQWGMSDFESQEQDRPEFEGEEISSPIDGEPMTYYSSDDSLLAIGGSMLSVLGMVSLVVGVSAAIFTMRWAMNDAALRPDLQLGAIDIAQLVPSLVNAMFILIFDALFTPLAEKLTDYENWRTDTSYEDALISKTFAFSFVNAYGPCFYVAFGKATLTRRDMCINGCLTELSYLLGSIFMVQILVQNCMEVGVPWYSNYKVKKEQNEGADPERQMSRVEKEFVMYTPASTFSQYKELNTQFGYAILFSVAYPLAPALALMSNYIEIRVDAWVLLQLSKRVIPQGTGDIGTWYAVFSLTSSIAVVTNVALLCFVSTRFQHYSILMRILFFSALEHGVFGAQILFQIFVDDIPKSTTIQLERQKFLKDKLIFDKADDILEDVDGDDEGGEETNDVIDDIADDDPDPAL